MDKYTIFLQNGENSAPAFVGAELFLRACPSN
jgi:hypothetical protein